jgi:hypothetical protein
MTAEQPSEDTDQVATKPHHGQGYYACAAEFGRKQFFVFFVPTTAPTTPVDQHPAPTKTTSHKIIL